MAGLEVGPNERISTGNRRWWSLATRFRTCRYPAYATNYTVVCCEPRCDTKRHRTSQADTAGHKTPTTFTVVSYGKHGGKREKRPEGKREGKHDTEMGNTQVSEGKHQGNVAEVEKQGEGNIAPPRGGMISPEKNLGTSWTPGALPSALRCPLTRKPARNAPHSA